MSGVLGWAVYLAVGAGAGLAAANYMYDIDGDGFVSGLVFVGALFLWPLVVGVVALCGVFCAGAWLLPAYRADRRREREQFAADRAERRDSDEVHRRREVDRLHRELGLPPIDWGEL